jgi:hypothetical protein
LQEPRAKLWVVEMAFEGGIPAIINLGVLLGEVGY